MKRFGTFTACQSVTQMCLSVSAFVLVTAAFGQGETPACDVSGAEQITIECSYDSAPLTKISEDSNPALLLTHSMISFETEEENYMRAELTFENLSKTALSASYSVYLAIADQSGKNYFRRLLPNVDLRKVAPGKPLTFSERLLMPALRSGRYTVELWIPRPDPPLRYDRTQNFLLSNRGMADRESGLNKLATLTIAR